MNEWLYGKEGYYAHYHEIGKKGDFYTSVSVSPLFGGSIASYLISLIDQNKLSKNATVCEIGAHKGYLTADVIQFIYTLRPALLQTLQFCIVERFEELQKVQKSYLYESFGDAVTIRWVDSLTKISDKEGFVFANEIFDAFGARLFSDGKEGYVENHRLVWDECGESLRQKGEVAVGYETFASELGSAFERSVFVTADYGQAWARDDISLRLYDNHTTIPFCEFDDLSSYFQQCDITYDVDFSHLKEAFAALGWKECVIKEQMSALVDFGLPHLLEQLHTHLPYEEYLKEIAKVKILISPDDMGSRFKFFIATKGLV